MEREVSSQIYVKGQRMQHYIAALCPSVTMNYDQERRLYDAVSSAVDAEGLSRCMP